MCCGRCAVAVADSLDGAAEAFGSVAVLCGALPASCPWLLCTALTCSLLFAVCFSLFCACLRCLCACVSLNLNTLAAPLQLPSTVGARYGVCQALPQATSRG